ncbi:MAG: single-stranded-DNA-specific exonuclease RecJ [Patescibacteria group bacterium]
MVNWNVLGRYDSEKDIIETILKSRGIKNTKEFLSTPTLNECFDQLPLSFKKSLKEAKKIIDISTKECSPIVIFGDYDSDGVNATAILYNFFKDEKEYKNIYYFIPNRFEHSYGISISAVDDVLKKFKKEEKILFITVDVGITAYKEIEYIKNLGHRVILTDHHQKPNKIPNADCIVWSDEICGAVISWILSKALGSKNKQSLANAALATITDLQTITGFNRVIVKKGLEILNNEPPLGLKKLLDISGKGEGEITTYELGWVIGPRLNASGRLETAEDSIRLLVEKDEKVLNELASNLNTKNIQRQEKTLEMYEIASEFDEKNLPKILFSVDEKYHEGIIGLVAAKLTQKYYRPSIVVCLMDEYGKGSARSVPGINIVEILRKYEDLLIDLGGHPMAAGFTIDKKNVDKLKKGIEGYAKKNINDKDLTPSINIDLEIPAKIINEDLVNLIDKLKPFGLGNEQPVFLTQDLGVVSCDIMGKDKQHLRLSLYDGERYYRAVYFGGAKSCRDLNTGSKIDLVYTLKKNEYNGNRNIDLIVKDFRKV